MPFLYPALTDRIKELPFYLAGIGIDWPQETLRRPAGYPDWQWIQTLEGKGVLTLEGKDYEVPPGQGILLAPGVPHEYERQGELWTTNWLAFHGAAVTPYLERARPEGSGVYRLSDSWRLKEVHRRIYYQSLETGPLGYLEGSLLVYELILALATHWEAPTRGTETRQSRLKPVMDHIHLHFAQDLAVEDLARLIGVTPQYLNQLFRKTLSVRPVEYLSLYRLSRAKEILAQRPDLSIGEVARSVGYSDINYFCRVFRKHEGKTPGDFRNQHGAYSDSTK